VLPVIGRETGPGNLEVVFQVAPDVIGVVSQGWRKNFPLL
jgi:hypothetical protein